MDLDGRGAKKRVARRYGLTHLLMDGESLLRLSSSTSAATTTQSCCLRVLLTSGLFTNTISRFSFRVCWQGEVRSSGREWVAFLQRPTGGRMALTGCCCRISRRGRGAIRLFADFWMRYAKTIGTDSSSPVGIHRVRRFRSTSSASSRNGLRVTRHGATAQARSGGSERSFRNGLQSELSRMNNSRRLRNGILNASCRRCSLCSHVALSGSGLSGFYFTWNACHNYEQI